MVPELQHVSHCMVDPLTAWWILLALHGGSSHCMVDPRTAWWILALHGGSSHCMADPRTACLAFLVMLVVLVSGCLTLLYSRSRGMHPVQVASVSGCGCAFVWRLPVLVCARLADSAMQVDAIAEQQLLQQRQQQQALVAGPQKGDLSFTPVAAHDMASGARRLGGWMGYSSKAGAGW